jgi:polyisoprenoid-binding protein YceI
MRMLALPLAAVSLLFTSTLQAQNLTRYQAEPAGSKVKIDGTSTVHEWTVESSIIGGYLELDPAMVADPQKAAPGKVKANVTVSIPARQLKSGTKAMDNVMHDALKAQQFPRIQYHLTELVLKETPKAANDPLRFDSKGELTVSGVTNKISMPVTMERVEPAKLKTSGSTSVKMTSFGIKPPAPKVALGLISTGDDVKISFEWLTALSEKTAEAK